MKADYIKRSFVRGAVQLVRRPTYVLGMIVLPLLMACFFIGLMWQGGVQNVPVGVVDMDRSELSRKLTRNLNALQQVEIKYHFKDFNEAVDAVKRGDVQGFIYMPSDLSQRALTGNQPRISYYINYAYFAPSSMEFKGFKTITVLSNAGIVLTVMQTAGIDENTISSTLQPIVSHIHMLGNPWLNYNYYLSNSFILAAFCLFVMLTAAYSIGQELKHGTSVQWLRTAGGSMFLALMSKLLPQTVIFTCTGWVIQWMLFGLIHSPLNCPAWHMMLLLFLTVIACQGWAVTIYCITPNFRYGTMLCSLFSILAFSMCAFSLPEEVMYPWVEAIGYTVPIKYYFLAYVDQALNGISLYYSRHYYAMLITFAIMPALLLWRLKRECKNPVYVP